MNIFERAARGKYRFASSKGQLTTEDLFDLPLQGRGANLDDIAVALDRELEAAAPKSFVSPTAADGKRSEIECKLEIVKHVIASKLAANAAAEQRQVKAEKRRKLLDALDRKEDEEIQGKSREQLLAELEALD